MIKTEVRLSDGRDAPLRIVDSDSTEQQASQTRVGRVHHTIQAFTKTPILGIDDWKGALTVVWGEAPSLYDLHIAQRAWYAESECLVSSIAWVGKNGAFEPVQCDVEDTYTSDPHDIVYVLHRLGW